MYGYIYKTTNLLNEKIYVGQHKSKNGEFDDSYYGSGKFILEAIDKYGKENFTCEILEWCETEEELNNKEIFWIKELKSTTKNNNYNISDGGYVPRLSGEANGNYGRKHTEEERARMRGKREGMPEEFKQFRSEYMTGKKWYNNGVEEHYFALNEIPEGYKLGRLRKRYKPTEREIIKNKIIEEMGEDLYKSSKKFIVNNGKFEMILPVCPDGFVKGRLPEHDKKIGASNKGKSLTEAHKQQISARFSGKNNPNYGVSRFGADNPHYGKKLTERSKNLISKSNSNRIHVHNGNINKSIKEDDIEKYLSLGYMKGWIYKK